MPKRAERAKEPSTSEPQVAIMAIVRGRVQGVGFRYEARSIAKSLGLTGDRKSVV